MGCVANSTGTEVLLQLEALRSAAQLSQLFLLTEKRKVRPTSDEVSAAYIVNIHYDNDNNNRPNCGYRYCSSDVALCAVVQAYM